MEAGKPVAECGGGTSVRTSSESRSSLRGIPLEDIIPPPGRRTYRSSALVGTGCGQGHSPEVTPAAGECSFEWNRTESLQSVAAIGDAAEQITPNDEGDQGGEQTFGCDSLWAHLREKEKQFDAKITALDETLLCAERGHAQRDGIIETLTAKVLELQMQLELAKKPGRGTEAINQRLLKRTVDLEEARAKISDLETELSAKDRIIHQLKCERSPPTHPTVRDRDAKSSNATAGQRSQKGNRLQGCRSAVPVVEAAAISSSAERSGVVGERELQDREKYNARLRTLQGEVNKLEQSYRVTLKERGALVEENKALYCRLEMMQQTTELRLAEATRDVQRKTERIQALEEEVKATRLSMARLIRVLGEIPEMRRYLRMGGIDEEFVFVGYSQELCGVPNVIQRLPNDETIKRWRSGSGGLTHPPGTGVDDGIYSGSPQLQSHNIYLNGRWCKQLQTIVDEENCFLRRAKLSLDELERGAQYGRGDGAACVPSPNDVLQGRQHDRDFWIPHAIFVEAQKFKSRYLPTLTVECFYPFLIAVNREWNERMTRRVKTTIRRKLSGLKHEQNACKRLCCITTSVAQPEPPGCQSRSQSFLACLWQRLKALRGEVKRCITSKSSLRLFGLYDQLVRCTLQELQDAQVKRAEILHERSKCQFSELCQGETESPDRKPNKATAREGMETTEALDISSTCQSEEMVCHSALPECYEKLWETSDRIYSRVSASCGDMHRFLEALWNQHQSRQQQHQSHDQSVDISTFSTRQEDHVPLPTLLRVIEGMLDFVEEVQGEILRARGTISEHVSLQTTGECGVRPTGREQCGANTKWEEDAPEGLYESIDEEYRCNRQLRTQAARR